ncbi:MAG: hypothetical protein WDA47_07910 [Bacilli bacterium]
MAKQLRDRRTGAVSFYFDDQVPRLLATGWYEFADKKMEVPVQKPVVEEEIEYPEPIKIGRGRKKKVEE